MTGIDKSDQIQVGNTTAFDTSVTFVGKGVFDGTQTPIPFAATVPEPPTYVAMLVGLALLVFGGPKLIGTRSSFSAR